MLDRLKEHNHVQSKTLDAFFQRIGLDSVALRAIRMEYPMEYQPDRERLPLELKIKPLGPTIDQLMSRSHTLKDSSSDLWSPYTHIKIDRDKQGRWSDMVEW